MFEAENDFLKKIKEKETLKCYIAHVIAYTMFLYPAQYHSVKSAV